MTTVTGRGAHRPGGLMGHRDEAEPRSNHVLEELGVLRPLSRDGRSQVTVRARRNPALVRHAGDSVVEAGLQGKPGDRRDHRINTAKVTRAGGGKLPRESKEESIIISLSKFVEHAWNLEL